MPTSAPAIPTRPPRCSGSGSAASAGRRAPRDVPRRWSDDAGGRAGRRRSRDARVDARPADGPGQVGVRITFGVIDLSTGPGEDAGRGTIAMLQVAFAGTFSATLEPSVRARLTMPCDVVMGDEAGIVSRLAEVDVLVTLAFNRELAAAATR